MKRWLFASAALVAAVILVAPGVTGRLAEDLLREGLAPRPDTRVTTLAYRRGWFASDGRFRVELAAGDATRALAAWAGTDVAADGSATLLVDARIDHGPLPLTSPARSAVHWLPGLASARAGLALELPDGGVLSLPAELLLHLGVDGGLRLDVRAAAGRREAGGAELAWGDATLALGFARGGRLEHAAANLGRFAYRLPERSLEFAAAELAAGLRQADHGLATGAVEFELRGLRSEEASVERLFLASDSRVDGGRLTAQADVALDGLATGAGRVDLHMALALRDLAAVELAPLLARLGNLAAVDTQPAPGEWRARLEPQLLALLAAGASVDIGSFELATADGVMRGRAAVDLPATDRAAGWSDLAFALEGDAELEIERALVDHNPLFREQLRPAVAAGFLQPAESHYRLQAEYAKGLMTVNGAPLPLPLPRRPRPAPGTASGT